MDSLENEMDRQYRVKLMAALPVVLQLGQLGSDDLSADDIDALVSAAAGLVERIDQEVALEGRARRQKARRKRDEARDFVAQFSVINRGE